MLKPRTLLFLLLLLTQNTFAQLSSSHLAHAAAALAQDAVEYDPAYFSIDYPNGDVPATHDIFFNALIFNGHLAIE